MHTKCVLPFLLTLAFVAEGQKKMAVSTRVEKLDPPQLRSRKIEILEKRRSFSVPELRSLNGSRNKSTNSVITFRDLGTSINPFTSISAGRNYLAVDNLSQTVALFRRGGTANAPIAQGPGNRVFLDINTKGGQEGHWQLSKLQLLNNQLLSGGNPSEKMLRFPEGVIVNAANSTDTNQLRLFYIARVLDGTNGDLWGGISTAGTNPGMNTVLKQKYWSSDDTYKMFNPTSWVTHPSGSVFGVYPEAELSDVSSTFLGRVLVLKYDYNSLTNEFDSTVISIPFNNANVDTATEVRDAQIAFSPNGQVGFVFISAFNPSYRNQFAMIPYYSKSTDGGLTWSDFTMIDFNKAPIERPYLSPDRDNFRNQMLGNYVRFEADSIFQTTNVDPRGKPVDYTLMEIDLAVDKFGLPHLMGTMAVISFGDTLLTTGAGFYRPGFGSWMVDIYVDPMGVARGIVIAKMKHLSPYMEIPIYQMTNLSSLTGPVSAVQKMEV